MFPYRLEPAPSPVAAPPPAAPDPPAPARPPRRAPAAAPLLALALLAGAVGGAASTLARTGSDDLLAALRPAPAAALAAPPAAAQATSVPAAPANVAGAVYARVSPSVVQVVVSGQVQAGALRSGSGSGVVVDQRGYVLTNHHVVDGARTISVRFAGGATREAQVLGTDRGNDLALLRVDLPPGVPAAPLGDSDRLQVGETAIAIGSPFGLEGTVTQGIVSATERTWAPGDGRVRRGLIQTDAPINPGNSGGPLLNAAGEVVGINTMIESPVRGSVGVGFAVPINTARRVMPELAAGARLEPVWLGISGHELDAAIARDHGLSVQSGVLIVAVVPNSPASRAGLRAGQGQNERIPRGGDVITAVDGKPVATVAQLTGALTGRRPGDTVQLTIVRAGATQNLPVQLQAWPVNP